MTSFDPVAKAAKKLGKTKADLYAWTQSIQTKFVYPPTVAVDDEASPDKFIKLAVLLLTPERQLSDEDKTAFVDAKAVDVLVGAVAAFVHLLPVTKRALNRMLVDEEENETKQEMLCNCEEAIDWHVNLGLFQGAVGVDLVEAACAVQECLPPI